MEDGEVERKEVKCWRIGEMVEEEENMELGMEKEIMIGKNEGGLMKEMMERMKEERGKRRRIIMEKNEE